MGLFRTLLLAHHVGGNHAINAAIEQFCENVNRRTEGQIRVTTVSNSVLGNMPALLQMVIDGRADMALPPQDRFFSLSPRLGCVGLPFVFDDHAHADRVLDGEFRDWAGPDLAGMGLEYLANWEWGFRQVMNSQHPILDPDDLRGLRIRVPPVMNLHASMLALGATPVIAEYAQLPRIYRRGLIDGQENPIAVICSQGAPKDQKYLSMLNYSYSIILHVINKRCFDGLTAKQQLVLKEESYRAGQSMRHSMRSGEPGQIDELAQAGVQIDYPQMARFKIRMAPVFEQMAELVGVQHVEAFMDMVRRAQCARPPNESTAPGGAE